MTDEGTWTIITLKEYIERRFGDQSKAIDAALAAAEKAVTKAEIATEKRFDSVNEFRKTLSDQASGFLQRGEFSALHKSLVDKLDIFGRTQNMLIGGLVFMSFIEPIALGLFFRWK